MDELRNQLKTTNRQFNFYMKHKMAMKNNLIGILDQTYPGVNTYFDSPARNDGSQKWVENVGIWRYISDISYSIGKRFTCYSMGFPFVACYDTDVLFFYAD